VKDEGANLNAMTMVLKIVINCDILGVEESLNGTCSVHVFSKTCQYATTEKIKYARIRSSFLSNQCSLIFKNV